MDVESFGVSGQNLYSENEEIKWSSSEEEDPEEPLYYPDFSQINWIRYSFIGVYSFILLLGSIGNVLVCWIVYKNRALHSPVNYYLANLGVTDLLVVLFVLPIKLYKLCSDAGINFMNTGTCAITRYVETVLVFASILTLVAVCLERFFVIVHPFQFQPPINQIHSRVRRALLLVWGIPLIASSPNLILPGEVHAVNLTSEYGSFRRVHCSDGYTDEFRFWYFLFLFIFIYLIPLVLIIISCVSTTYVLMHKIPREIRANQHSLWFEKERRKVAKMILAVVVVFFLTWSPYFVVTIITQLQKVNFLHNYHFFFTMLTINFSCFVNSCLNPIIYCVMSRRFRRGFRSFLPKVCLAPFRRDSRSTPPTLNPMDNINIRLYLFGRPRRKSPNVGRLQGEENGPNCVKESNGGNEMMEMKSLRSHRGHKFCHLSPNTSSSSRQQCQGQF